MIELATYEGQRRKSEVNQVYPTEVEHECETFRASLKF
jgi:hypothetical protein